jgi:hypothetical protein
LAFHAALCQLCSMLPTAVNSLRSACHTGWV